jgi:hypothetical protein
MIGSVGPGDGPQRKARRTRDDFRHPLIRVGEMSLVKMPEPVQAGRYGMWIQHKRINQPAIEQLFASVSVLFFRRGRYHAATFYHRAIKNRSCLNAHQRHT